MRTLLIVAAFLSVTACSKGGGEDQKKKMAGLCVEATNQIEHPAGEVDDETFKMQLSNVLQACSGGCDAKDDASCKSLDGHFAKICGVSVGMCDSLCETAKSPSLKKYACDHGTKK